MCVGGIGIVLTDRSNAGVQGNVSRGKTEKESTMKMYIDSRDINTRLGWRRGKKEKGKIKGENERKKEKKREGEAGS